MPVVAPRPLLRDVAHAKMLEAVQDGTLEPEERLNDDQLIAWLGVSRTPVREAIARLASEGLIEMAANRYTRVASQSTDAFREAADLAGDRTRSAAAGLIRAVSADSLRTTRAESAAVDRI